MPVNPSYWGGGGRRITVWGQSGQSSQKIYVKNNLKAQSLGCVAQVVEHLVSGPEVIIIIFFCGSEDPSQDLMHTR
jgi:hypothetical protein